MTASNDPSLVPVNTVRSSISVMVNLITAPEATIDVIMHRKRLRINFSNRSLTSQDDPRMTTCGDVVAQISLGLNGIGRCHGQGISVSHTWEVLVLSLRKRFNLLGSYLEKYQAPDRVLCLKILQPLSFVSTGPKTRWIVEHALVHVKDFAMYN